MKIDKEISTAINLNENRCKAVLTFYSRHVPAKQDKFGQWEAPQPEVVEYNIIDNSNKIRDDWERFITNEIHERICEDLRIKYFEEEEKRNPEY